MRLDEAAATVTADSHGNWKVVLPPVKADGKSHRLVVRGKNEIVVDDILIGDVWLGSGQSNMEMGITLLRQGGKGSSPRHGNRRSGCCSCRE